MSVPASPWVRSRTYLLGQWRPWSVVIGLVGLFAWFLSEWAAVFSRVTPKPGTPSFGITFMELGLFLLIEIVGSTFVGSGEMGLLLDGSRNGVAPSFRSFFRRGWELWSWTWRGAGFLVVVILVILAAIGLLSALATAAHVPGVVDNVLFIVVYLALLVVGVPIAFWTVLAGFAYRPEPYRQALIRVWRIFATRPGRVLAPVWASLAVALVAEVPFALASISSPVTQAGPFYLVFVWVVSAFGLWCEMTILYDILDGQTGDDAERAAE